MNIDKSIDALESGYTNPQTALYRTEIEDQYMEQLRIRRRTKDVSHQRLWCFSIGEAGQAPAVFYDYVPSRAVKKERASRL